MFVKLSAMSIWDVGYIDLSRHRFGLMYIFRHLTTVLIPNIENFDSSTHILYWFWDSISTKFAPDNVLLDFWMRPFWKIKFTFHRNLHNPKIIFVQNLQTKSKEKCRREITNFSTGETNKLMCAHTTWIIVINNKTLQINFFLLLKKKLKKRKNECLKATEGTYDNKMFVLHNQELISCTFCKKVW